MLAIPEAIGSAEDLRQQLLDATDTDQAALTSEARNLRAQLSALWMQTQGS